MHKWGEREVWRGGLEGNQKCWEDLKVRMHFKVGFGNRVKFWKDR